MLNWFVFLLFGFPSAKITVVSMFQKKSPVGFPYEVLRRSPCSVVPSRRSSHFWLPRCRDRLSRRDCSYHLGKSKMGAKNGVHSSILLYGGVLKWWVSPNNHGVSPLKSTKKGSFWGVKWGVPPFKETPIW